MEILEDRVEDPWMLRLIRNWLRVGWVEEGTRHPGTIGTPQGSVISPLLANIFLNAVMDRWASRWRREDANGDMIAAAARKPEHVGHGDASIACRRYGTLVRGGVISTQARDLTPNTHSRSRMR